ncbi:S58 family peptidase [Ktedonosporobacter rubrisoli]|uniref:S58 family peptidase n=1 Tax=Ktedonosporobacter rubrisoli TaxID=2509675 RepID=A0A4P6JLN4_KTERU|nr:P1 family peptidase [Ktedonosporobacter rubrisoli]QBD76139.1 S58 family peptidase [Ktedonosporobacter rubrisoli]
MRARDLGITIGTLQPGPHNAITDVAGVRVGFTTLVEGEGALKVGHGPIRTGVTVIMPHEGNVWREPLFAGSHRLNGNGEMTGLEWIKEAGMLMSPIGLTNTHSVGVVRDALVSHAVASHGAQDVFWALPVVAETYDGLLNDVNGLHVRPEHVAQAIASASSGPLAEGNVGSGTGMICHGFKGGIGTASRRVNAAAGGYTVGVLVQANHGRRERLRINGIAVGEAIPDTEVPVPDLPFSSQQVRGSIIVVIATDAPLIPTQCMRLAQRAGLGIARTGGVGEHTSGDLFLAFSTANRGIPASEYSDNSPLTVPLTMLSNTYITDLFDAVVEATEEAIVNTLLAATTLSGRDGITAYALPHARLREVMQR